LLFFRYRDLIRHKAGSVVRLQVKALRHVAPQRVKDGACDAQAGIG
jgi:hypothetical protein